MALSTFERDLLLLHDVSINIIFIYIYISNMFVFRTDPLWGMAFSTFERDLLLLHDIDI